LKQGLEIAVYVSGGTAIFCTLASIANDRIVNRKRNPEWSRDRLSTCVIVLAATGGYIALYHLQWHGQVKRLSLTSSIDVVVSNVLTVSIYSDPDNHIQNNIRFPSTAVLQMRGWDTQATLSTSDSPKCWLDSYPNQTTSTSCSSPASGRSLNSQSCDCSDIWDEKQVNLTWQGADYVYYNFPPPPSFMSTSPMRLLVLQVFYHCK